MWAGCLVVSIAFLTETSRCSRWPHQVGPSGVSDTDVSGMSCATHMGSSVRLDLLASRWAFVHGNGRKRLRNKSITGSTPETTIQCVPTHHAYATPKVVLNRAVANQSPNTRRVPPHIAANESRHSSLSLADQEYPRCPRAASVEASLVNHCDFAVLPA